MLLQTSAFLASALVIAAALSPPANADPLRAHLWKHRVVVVFAPTTDDLRLERQRAIFEAASAAMADRDLILVEATGDSAQARALRRQFSVGQDAFRAILVGKDGGAKLTAESPLSAVQLRDEIDRMPMRQEEMGRDERS